jgi:hypothetical protein
MTIARQSAPSLFSQVDVSTSFHPHPAHSREDQAEILRDILTAQDRTNELLVELVNTLGAAQRQRMNELKEWRAAHPELADACREAAEALTCVQVDFLDRMTDDIRSSSEDMLDGEYVLNEFIDRYGPRLAQLNGVLQVLAQLGSTANPPSNENEDE